MMGLAQAVDYMEPEHVELCICLLHLFDALDDVDQAMREAALEAVYMVVERENLSVWEKALEAWK
jgi:hypothetical protein